MCSIPLLPLPVLLSAPSDSMPQLLLFVNLTGGLIDLNYGQEPKYNYFDGLAPIAPTKALLLPAANLLLRVNHRYLPSLRSLGTLNRHIKLSSSPLP